MKTSNKIIILGIAAFMAIAVIGMISVKQKASENLIKGNGVIKELVYEDLASFNNLDIERFDFELIQSEQEKVVVQTDENLFDGISVMVTEKGTLKIESSKGQNYLYSKVKVKVYFKDIFAITNSSGFCKGTVKQDKFMIKFSAGAKGELNIDSKKMVSHITSGAKVDLTGKADSMVITGGSGAKLNGQQFNTKSCSVNIGSGTKVNINVVESIEATVSSGAKLVYYGNPSVSNVEASSGGTVKKGE